MTALLPLATDQAPAPLLTVSGLAASFGSVRALNGVDLAVQPGELIALAGENGAGKTTLVRCIAGDITPASGEIYLAGRKVAADPVAAAKQGIAVVWQDLALLVLVVLVAWSTLLGRTRFGRYVYAIGGNAEAARRAGINLSRIRVLAFGLAGLTAGIMGIIYASFQGGISSNVNGGQNVLFAVAAAVIGGTSLFGGRGKMLGAVLGGLIVAVIYNGLLLLSLGPAAQDMWTAAVLLAAVTVDTLARRGRAAQ